MDSGDPAPGTPTPYAFNKRFSTGAITSVQEKAPMASITCCRQGVAPTR
jgi:hypothetical protein